MIDGGKMMRDQLLALADTQDRNALGTTSMWWREEIRKIVEDYDNFADFLKHGEDNMMPKMADSVFTISLVTGQPDAKFCMELGAAIMYDKPIIAAVFPGAKVPDELRRIAHNIVEVDLDDPDSQERVAASISALLDQLREDGVIGGDEGVVS